MMKDSLNAKDPGRPNAVTNADEQEVAVNHSSKEDGGYDEVPAERQPASRTETEKEGKEDVKKDEKPAPGHQVKSNKPF